MSQRKRERLYVSPTHSALARAAAQRKGKPAQRERA
jgi:hypothetical protein